MKEPKPTQYTIEIKILPQGNGWEGADLTMKLGEIARDAVIKPEYPALLRRAVRMFEQSVGMDMEDFPQ